VNALEALWQAQALKLIPGGNKALMGEDRRAGGIVDGHASDDSANRGLRTTRPSFRARAKGRAPE
jgi:hypothetical protein